MSARSLALILLLAFLAGCATTPGQLRQIRKNPEIKILLPETVSVGSAHLKGAFAPDAMGRMVSLNYAGEEILTRFERKALVGNPLFAPVNNNVFGFRELFWAVRMTTLDQAAKLVSKTDDAIEFSIANYGNRPLDLHRKVRFLPDSSIIEFKSTFTNSSKTNADYQLWLNLLPRPPYRPVVPAKDGIVTTFKLGNNFHPAGADWIGACLERPAGVIALEWNEGAINPGGEFYIHGAQDFNTFEAILGKQSLAPGANCEHAYRILFFPELTGLNAIWQNCGLELIPAAKGFSLRICAAAPFTSQRISLEFSDGTQAEIMLPAISPCTTAEVAIDKQPSFIVTSKGHRIPFVY